MGGGGSGRAERERAQKTAVRPPHLLGGATALALILGRRAARVFLGVLGRLAVLLLEDLHQLRRTERRRPEGLSQKREKRAGRLRGESERGGGRAL